MEGFSVDSLYRLGERLVRRLPHRYREDALQEFMLRAWEIYQTKQQDMYMAIYYGGLRAIRRYCRHQKISRMDPARCPAEPKLPEFIAREEFEAMVRPLTGRSLFIVRQIFQHNRSRISIAAELHLSRSRVGQLFELAMEEIRRHHHTREVWNGFAALSR